MKYDRIQNPIHLHTNPPRGRRLTTGLSSAIANRVDMTRKTKKPSTSTKTRATRIDKDVKTTLMHSRVLSFLYDFMWSYRYFPQLACVLLLVEACAGYVIIQKVPCTYSFLHAIEETGQLIGG